MAAAGRTSATLEVTSGTPVLTIGVAELGGTLLRVSTPDYAPVRPVLSGSGPVVLSLDGTSPSGPARREAVTRCGWCSIPPSCGTWTWRAAPQRTAADLRGGRAGEITVTAGSDILDVTLPRPTGTTALRLAGGESQLLVSLPGGVPAQVTVGGGASFVMVDGQSLAGVAGGTVLTPPGWASAASRFDIDATAGVSRLTVSRWSE